MIKKFFVIFVVFFLGFWANTVFAQYVGPTHLTTVQTVVMASGAGDDVGVVLEGNLVTKLRDEHYRFQDKTGEIEVEIDDHLFPATPINEHTVVRLHGKVDKDFARTATVEVKQLEVLTP